MAFVDALEIDLRWQTGLAGNPFLGAHSRLRTDRRGEDIRLESLGAAGHSKRDGLDISIINGLESSHDLVLVYLGFCVNTVHIANSSVDAGELTLTPRFGRNATPRWGSGDLYSDKNSNLSFSYSK